VSVNLHSVVLGEGPPVALIHGLLLGSLAQWYFGLGPALSPSHRVLLYDLRGHGLSEPTPSGYDLGTLADDLTRLLATHALPAPVDLVGHSYGGLVALRYALRNPGAVRRLVLVDVPLPPGDGDLLAQATTATPEALLDLLPAAVRDEVLAGRRRARRLVERIRALVQDTTLLADLAAEPEIDDDALAGLAMPTLCIVGERSRCRPAADRLVRVLPDARLAVVPGGHFVPVEAPAELTAATVGFLRG